MKTFIAILAFCCVGVLASTREERLQAREICMKESNVTYADMEYVLLNGITDLSNENLGRYFACLLKNLGIMNTDRTFNTEAAPNLYESETPKEKIIEVFERCNPVTTKETTDSVAALQLMECVLSTQDS